MGIREVYIMDIAALSVAASLANTQASAQMAVLKMGKEQLQQSGADMIQMMKSMELSVNPNVGANIDISL